MMRQLSYCINLAFFILLPMQLNGQTVPPISTDRPDQTESAFLVPQRYLQAEIGILTQENSSSQSSSSLPGFLFRYGLVSNMEIRLTGEHQRLSSGGSVQSGLVPVSVGIKVHLMAEDGPIPQAAFVGHITMPGAASSAFRTTYVAPSFRFAFAHSLTDNMSLGYNAGAGWDGSSAEPVFIYTASAGLSLTSVMGAFVEIYGNAPQRSKANHGADGGLTYLLTSDLMIDISGGVGLTSNAPDYFISAGISFRLPL